MEQERDPAEAFSAFVRSRSAALLRTAFLLTGDHHGSQDLLQTALWKAARRWSRIEGDPEPYVRRILYNEHVSMWRRRRYREFVTDQVPGDGYVDPDVTMRLSVLQALSRLTAKQRAVLVLRYYEDRTERETAAVLGIGVGTVKSTSRQALARLRVVAPELEELGPMRKGQ